MVYIDIDGVLADFEGWMYDMYPGFDQWESSRVVHQNMIDNVDSVFLNSGRLPYFRYLKSIYDKGNCKLLTSVGNFWDTLEMRKQAENNKIIWCEANGFSIEDVIIVGSPEEKLNYCELGDVLYDDRYKTITAWNSKGGLGFLVENTARRIGEY